MLSHEVVQQRLLERGDIFSDVCRLFVNRLGFQLTRSEPPVPDDAGSHGFTMFFFKPHSEFARRFSLSQRELLCLVSTFPEVDARCIRDARSRIAHELGRLESDFVLIVAADEATKETVESLSSGDPEVFAAFSFSEVRQLVRKETDIWLEFERRAISKDLYDLRSAIRTSKDFFGRQRLLATVQATLANDGTPIGLFGLRKVGKTSFLFQLLERLRKRGVRVAHVDFQLVDSVERSRNYLLWTIAQAIGDSLSASEREAAGATIGAIASERSRGTNIAEGFVQDVRRLLTIKGLRLVLALDEIDLMLNGNRQSGWELEFVSTWRLLRGLAQESRGQFSIFITGTNPHLVERSSVAQEDNPIFAWIDTRFIGPLERDESEQLLTKLGLTMRLQWEPEALSFVWDKTGGHPLLTRIVGSEIHRHLKDRSQLVRVDLHTIREAMPSIERATAPVLTQILELLRENYADEYTLLEAIANGKYKEAEQYYSTFHEEFDHLVGYGLLRVANGVPSLSISLVEEWLRASARRNLSSAVAATAPTSSPASAPVIDGLTVSARLGRPGGLADVYEGEMQSTGQRVAVKVYRSKNLAPLQREVDAVSRIVNHHLVRIIMACKTVDGRACLIMEHLDGATLDSYITPARCLTESELFGVCDDVLDALEALHPNDARVNELRAKPALTLDEFEDLGIARHGYIHRDIKPSNVMLVPRRGAVVFDFNIASPANQAVNTISETPGYLPPDLRRGDHWNPRVDLYALGLTLAQVGTGVALHDATDGAREDLLTAVTGKLAPDVSRFLGRLLGSTDLQPFSTASEARAALKTIRGVRAAARVS